MPCRQWMETTIFYPIKLYEYIIPNFYHLWMIIIHQGCTFNQSALVICPAIHVYLSTWSTGPGISHLPEVILLTSQQYLRFRQILLPFIECLLIHRDTMLFISLKYSGINSIRRNPILYIEQFPTPSNSFFFKITG